MKTRVIVTRPAREAQGWVASLQRSGLDAMSLPLIEIAGPPDPSSVVQAWQQLPHFDAAMFVSGNAVEQFFSLKPAVAPADSVYPAIKIRAMVTGPASVAALQRAGVEPDWIDAPPASAGQFDSEALWAVMGHRVHPGYRLMLVRGVSGGSCAADSAGPGETGETGARAETNVKGPTGKHAKNGVGRDWFSQQVLSAGGLVDYVVAYQRACPAYTPEFSARLTDCAGHPAVWIFSSSEAIANLTALAPGHDWSQHTAVCTHARIAKAAQTAGFGVVCESRPVLAEVVSSIESLQ